MTTRSPAFRPSALRRSALRRSTHGARAVGRRAPGRSGLAGLAAALTLAAAGMAGADAPQGAAPVAGATGAGAAGTDVTGAKASVAKASVADTSAAGATVANASAESATDAGATGAGAESAAGGLARPAQGPATPPLLCLGTAPRFVLAVRPDGARGATATFDYLGDGSFSFAPPPRPGLVASRHALATAGGPLPVALEARACPALGVDFPITLRIEIQAGGGTTTFLGCCLWQDG